MTTSAYGAHLVAEPRHTVLGHHQVAGQVAVMHVGDAAVALVEPAQGRLQRVRPDTLHP